MKRIIIQGSARTNGNTHKIAQLLQAQLDFDLIDLNAKTILPFDYEHKNKEDDFLALMKNIVTYDLIIFATPVYWYAMSGIMKTFFDRITDCLSIEKHLGRSLASKSLGVISCGSDSEITEGFFVPFKNSADYLDMKYVGHLHTWIEDSEPTKEVIQLVQSYAEHLSNLYI